MMTCPNVLARYFFLGLLLDLFPCLNMVVKYIFFVVIYSMSVGKKCFFLAVKWIFS